MPCIYPAEFKTKVSINEIYGKVRMITGLKVTCNNNIVPNKVFNSLHKRNVNLDKIF